MVFGPVTGLVAALASISAAATPPLLGCHSLPPGAGRSRPTPPRAAVSQGPGPRHPPPPQARGIRSATGAVGVALARGLRSFACQPAVTSLPLDAASRA